MTINSDSSLHNTNPQESPVNNSNDSNSIPLTKNKSKAKENEEKKEKRKTKSELTTNMQCSKALHVKEKKNEFSRPKENNQKKIKENKRRRQNVSQY